MPYRIIGNQRERAVAWAVQRFPPYPGHWDDASALILEKDGDITAVVLYNHWYLKNSVDISIAAIGGKSWLTRAFLRAAFGAPFIEWQMRRITLQIPADNVRSLRFAQHLGFVQEGRIREAYAAGIDIIVMGMLKRECRFLGHEYSGKTFGTNSARSGRNRAGADAIQHCDGHVQRRA